jgi:hypothetical protein
LIFALPVSAQLWLREFNSTVLFGGKQNMVLYQLGYILPQWVGQQHRLHHLLFSAPNLRHFPCHPVRLPLPCHLPVCASYSLATSYTFSEQLLYRIKNSKPLLFMCLAIQPAHMVFTFVCGFFLCTREVLTIVGFEELWSKKLFHWYF